MEKRRRTAARGCPLRWSNLYKQLRSSYDRCNERFSY